ncbi:MAG: 3-phosphoshikimate 1-carboxyvinyltransferase [Polyangiaceae bacterium]|nr:3-phosphoshikimate 1-carboxyvinyltransferase [Polyangiaceae bacterium]
MARLIVQPQPGPLTGSVPVPSDKSIGHRALMLASLARGRSTLRGFSYGEDNVATLAAFRAMGIAIDDAGDGTVHVTGKGLYGLAAPAGALDCGNSGTTMRLLSGILAGQHFASRLIGDESLSSRPMGRVVAPLRQRGGRLEGRAHPTRSGDLTAPLDIGPLERERLEPLAYAMPVPSAQVKSALLLSGLYASGPTEIAEGLVTRDHTERLLSALGLPVYSAGAVVSLHPPADPGAISGFELELPGDLSAAAFLLVAAALIEGSRVTCRRTGLNPTRSGILDVLRAFGAQVGFSPQGDRLGEPVGEVTVAASRLVASDIGGEVAVRAIDEIPIACALGARASGVTRIADVAELRVKESDRIAAIVEVLRAFGVDASEQPDGLVMEGRPDGPLLAARVHSRGDHRVAMTAAVLGLLADGTTIVDDVDCIATSFPRFAGTLRALGAEVKVES